jgi:hypothetical protein
MNANDMFCLLHILEEGGITYFLVGELALN